MSKRTNLPSVLLAAMLILLSPLAAFAAPASTIPAFRLPGLDGKSLDAHELRGHRTLVIFWTTWCIACREEVPALNALHEADPGLHLVAIDMQDSPGRVAKVIKELHVSYPVFMDRSGQVAHAFGVVGAPTSIVVDAKGRIVYRDNALPSRIVLE